MIACICLQFQTDQHSSGKLSHSGKCSQGIDRQKSIILEALGNEDSILNFILDAEFACSSVSYHHHYVHPTYQKETLKLMSERCYLLLSKQYNLSLLWSK